VDIPPPGPIRIPTADEPLRIVFVGQAVARKGLSVLLAAFEALRDHVPSTLTLVGSTREEVAHLMLDGRGVTALGKVSDAEKVAQLQAADVLCAPSLGRESFGMVLTEAFAAGTPVVASDIAGYRDVVRGGSDGILVAPGDPIALAEGLRRMALEPQLRAEMAASARERAERFAWPRVAAEVAEAYADAIATPKPVGAVHRTAVRYGLRPADLQPHQPARRLQSLEPVSRTEKLRRGARRARRVGVVAATGVGAWLGVLGVEKIGLPNVVASLVASRPSFVLLALGLMAAAMVVRGLAWHAVLRAAPATEHARRIDALQGTFAGVLMSATLPARLGEPSRALIVARRLGRARERLPIVAGTMLFQTIVNLIALTGLATALFAQVDPFSTHHRLLLLISLAPVIALSIVLIAPELLPAAAASRSARAAELMARLHASLLRIRSGLDVLRRPRQAAIAALLQLSAWALQMFACFTLLHALGIAAHDGVAAAAAVLFAVNATALIPVLPSNVGVFQAACVAVLHGAFHVDFADALAYGLVLQAVELATAFVVGTPALVREGMSWRELRRRAMQAAPVSLHPQPSGSESARHSEA
jgi:phosphatidylinositol alpha-mannosyltransferase